jgi:hypothetical protein
VAAIAAAALAGAIVIAPAARAGTIYLLNGEEIDGDILGVTADEVTIKYGFGSMRINLREVRDIELRTGESVWEKEIKNALENSRRLMNEESKRRLAGRLKGEEPPPSGPKPAGAQDKARGSTLAPKPGTPAAPPPATRRFGRLFESAEWGFRLGYPVQWEPREAARGFFTFRDPHDTGRTSWSFAVTAFDDTEGNFEAIVARAERELGRLAHYKVVSRRGYSIGRGEGQRTVAVYEKGGHAIRHDQVIARGRRGVLIFDFFSPGAPLDEGGVPEVEGVLASVEIR